MVTFRRWIRIWWLCRFLMLGCGRRRRVERWRLRLYLNRRKKKKPQGQNASPSRLRVNRELQVADVVDSFASPPARAEAPRVRVRVPLGANRPAHGLVVRRVRDRFRMRGV